MNISDNIIKVNLKNVLFITGGAYGGKTTMAKLLEKKYGFKRYREGDMRNDHLTYATPEAQPAMCFDRSQDWNAFFNQPVEDYHKWLTDGVYEEAEMVIVDLIKLSQAQTVVADVMIPIEILTKIADFNQVVILCAPVQMKREHFFDREDKKPILDLILSMPTPEATLENVLHSLTYKGEEEVKGFLESGFKCIMRTNESTIERTLAEIEEHLHLAK